MFHGCHISRLIFSGRNSLLSIVLSSSDMTGVNSMNGRISFSISIPGAISISVRQLAGKFEYRTFRNIENVLVSLFDGIFTGECDMFDISLNLIYLPSLTISMPPSLTFISLFPAVNVPRKHTVLAPWVIFMNPPVPSLCLQILRHSHCRACRSQQRPGRRNRCRRRHKNRIYRAA